MDEYILLLSFILTSNGLKARKIRKLPYEMGTSTSKDNNQFSHLIEFG